MWLRKDSRPEEAVHPARVSLEKPSSLREYFLASGRRLDGNNKRQENHRSIR